MLICLSKEDVSSIITGWGGVFYYFQFVMFFTFIDWFGGGIVSYDKKNN